MSAPARRPSTANRAPRRNEEERLQQLLVSWAAWQCPDLLIVHNRNSGMSKAENARAKAMGAKAGVPDLWVMDRTGGMLWVEIKEPRRGVLSDSQREFHRVLRERSHAVVVVKSLDEFKDALVVAGML